MPSDATAGMPSLTSTITPTGAAASASTTTAAMPAPGSIVTYPLDRDYVAVFADYRARGGLWASGRSAEEAAARLAAGEYGSWQDDHRIAVTPLGNGYLAVYTDYRYAGGQWVTDSAPERAVQRLRDGDYGIRRVPEFAE